MFNIETKIQGNKLFGQKIGGPVSRAVPILSGLCSGN